MIDYQAIQLTGSRCQGKNCACSSDAMAIYFGTNGRIRLTADQVRAESGISCIPGQATPSGGLFISDVVRVAKAHGVKLDYGSDALTYYERWATSVTRSRLSTGWGAIKLGDYGEVPAPIRAPGSTFQDDHSVFMHDFLTHLPAHGGRKATETVCWHDPLRTKPIRAPWTVVLAYGWKPSSSIRGFAGFVKPAPVAPDTGLPRVAYGADVPADIRALDPTGRSAQEWIKRTGVGPEHWNPPLNLGDFAAALDRAGIPYGGVVNRGDVINLSEWRAA